MSKSNTCAETKLGTSIVQSSQPICKGCHQAIESPDVVEAVDSDWHPACFRCSTCNNPLSSWYIEKAGQLYCKKDFWAKFGHLCNGCAMVISGPVMVAGEHRYHPECFQCSHCHGHVGEGEPYALVERSALFCGRCYRLRSAPSRPHSLSATSDPPRALGITTSNPVGKQQQGVIDGEVVSSSNSQPPPAPGVDRERRRPHTIQMLEIPPLLVDYDQIHQRQHRLKHHRKREQQQKRLSSELPSNKTSALSSPDPDKSHVVQHGDSPDKAAAVEGDGGGEKEEEQKRRPLQLSILESERSGRRSLLTQSGFIGPHITISKLENLPELNCLQVGDRLLEVDGSPVKEQSMPEIMELLNNHSTPLQVMLERDPSPIRPPKTEGEAPASPSSPSSPPATSGISDSGEKTVMVQDTPVRLRSKASLKAHGHSPSRRRSKSPSPCPVNRQKSVDLTRSHSFSTHKQDHRVFRAIDLIEGEILGQGFFGKAIKAKHRITGEQMVLKELHNFDEDAQKGFLREVSMLRNLSHPCVLKFMGVLYRDKKLTLVTEFINGGTLCALLKSDEELSWLQRLKFAKDIAAGMKYLHSMDIIHRDLNSNNCFVRKDGSVVVADFGLAKIVPRHEFLKLGIIQEDSSKKSTNSKSRRFNRKKRQTVVGNPYWMAPEMITKGIYDEKVDVFSYGVIVCETIARVTADPDVMPRSIDLGVNVEAFHTRFCHSVPEPYVMLAAMCSHMVPESRPNFEEIHVLCEALHLHLEHGMAVPQELQGSSVDFYRRMKERLYGKGYKDGDSVKEAKNDHKQKTPEKESQDHEQSLNMGDKLEGSPKSVTNSDNTKNSTGESLSNTCRDVDELSSSSNSDPKHTASCSCNESVPQNPSQSNRNILPMNSAQPTSLSSPNDATFTTATQSKNSMTNAQRDANGTSHVEKVFAELTIDNLTTNSSSGGNCAGLNEDFAYFSCSSLSQSPSVSSLSLCAEDFNPCKMSPMCSSDTTSDPDKYMSLGHSSLALDSSHDLSHSSLDDHLMQEVHAQRDASTDRFEVPVSSCGDGCCPLNSSRLLTTSTSNSASTNTLSSNSMHEAHTCTDVSEENPSVRSSLCTCSSEQVRESPVVLSFGNGNIPTMRDGKNSSSASLSANSDSNFSFPDTGKPSDFRLSFDSSSAATLSSSSSCESSFSVTPKEAGVLYLTSPSSNVKGSHFISDVEPRLSSQSCDEPRLEVSPLSVTVPTSRTLSLNDSHDSICESSTGLSISPINDSLLSSSRQRRNKMKSMDC